jgi:serum/glucocorticoid-regulated kinase 2
MIDGDGHIALVDFGLAKLHVSEFKGAKTMAGSPQYTAPELLLPKAKRSYGKAADWWSLGILLYEMSVGKSPFYDNNIDKMYKKIQNDPLTFPAKPELPEDLKDLLRAVRALLYQPCYKEKDSALTTFAALDCSSCKRTRQSD